MILLILFAFLAGIVTVLSPCILPLLPIILSSSDTTGKQKPLGVVVGFIASFTFFTLFLSAVVKLSGVPAEALRYFSIVVLVAFGLSLLIPQIQIKLERLFSKLAGFASAGQNRVGFVGGVLIGLSLGLLWTPCVGPILASVISLAITGTVTIQAVFITLAYATGTAIPMFIIMYAGTTALKKVPWLVKNTANIQKAFGVLMIVTAVGIYFNIDRKFQTYILTAFPNYGAGLTKFEDNTQVKDELRKLNAIPADDSTLGKPMEGINKPKGPIAPELIQGGDWFNSNPLQLSDLRGKVVLIDFWTYSCINCQRTFPYLKTWWEKYKDKGLVIIGIHSPEFEFEKNPANVKQALQDFNLKYPVMQDNDFATWKAYKNQYWPAKYLLDKEGYIRYTHFGEGDYDQTEQIIQQLLSESGAQKIDMEISNPDYQIYSRTPELYLGFARIDYLASPEKIAINRKSIYTKPTNMTANHFAFEGEWSISAEYAEPTKGSKLYLNFEAKEVFLVARSKNGPGSMKIYIDNELKYFGEDSANGTVTVQTDKLYKLINLPAPGRHELRIEFEEGEIEVYAFTFG